MQEEQQLKFYAPNYKKRLAAQVYERRGRIRFGALNSSNTFAAKVSERAPFQPRSVAYPRILGTALSEACTAELTFPGRPRYMSLTMFPRTRSTAGCRFETDPNRQFCRYSKRTRNLPRGKKNYIHLPEGNHE